MASGDSSRVSRLALAKIEHHFDRFLVTKPDECDLLGNTRGVYLDNYGVVFTSMVALVPTPAPSPFRSLTVKDIEDIHARKIRQLPIMREKMRDMLLMVAADPGLDSVRPDEQVVCGVTFFYYKQWENMSGLPQQIVMQAEKQKLLQVQSGRVPRAAMDSFVKTQEL